MDTPEQIDLDNLLGLSEWQQTNDSNATDATDRTDRLERRRLQNRQAQRNHRKKTKAYISSLEQRVVENMLRGKQETYMPTPSETPLEHALEPTSPLFMPLDILPETSSPASPLSLPTDVFMVPTPEDQQSATFSTPLDLSQNIAPCSQDFGHTSNHHVCVPFAPFPGKPPLHTTGGMGCECVINSMPFQHNPTHGASWQDMAIYGNGRASELNRSHHCSPHLGGSGQTVPDLQHHSNSDPSIHTHVIRCPRHHPSHTFASQVTPRADQMPPTFPPSRFPVGSGNESKLVHASSSRISV
ncbi:hypothetical protein FBEOM_4502 [Fusarium beomiforme]|uniref:BZIP domain-containing protein n=1 Tax=Fusarium beomiforme TaxID=44412 RepID=A0A9P5AMT0_9HYPO|nr:hypothetical protein FBEOM_4502 [Fusarium beomiforme]